MNEFICYVIYHGLFVPLCANQLNFQTTGISGMSTVCRTNTSNARQYERIRDKAKHTNFHLVSKWLFRRSRKKRVHIIKCKPMCKLNVLQNEISWINSYANYVTMPKLVRIAVVFFWGEKKNEKQRAQKQAWKLHKRSMKFSNVKYFHIILIEWR